MTLTPYARLHFSNRPTEFVGAPNRDLENILNRHPDAVSVQFFNAAKKDGNLTNCRDYSHTYFPGAKLGPDFGMMTTSDGQPIEMLPTYIIIPAVKQASVTAPVIAEQKSPEQSQPQVYEPAMA